MNFLQASCIAIISAWKTVVCIGSRILSAIISLFLYCMVKPEPACWSVKLPSVYMLICDSVGLAVWFKLSVLTKYLCGGFVSLILSEVTLVSELFVSGTLFQWYL